MNIVNYSELPPGQVNESWLKTLARKLRGWLNGFLAEPDPSAVDEGQGPGAASSPSVSAARNAQDRQRAEQSSGIGDQTEVPPEGLGEDAGPPEAWLALVRERAPELLLPIEEGETPLREAFSAATEGSKPVEGRLSAPSPPVPLAEPRSLRRQEARQSAPHGRSNSETPAKTTWLQSLKRKFAPVVPDSVPEGMESRRVTGPLAAEHQSGKTAERNAPAGTARWSEQMRRKIQGVLHPAPARTSLSKAEVVEKEERKPHTHLGNPASTSPIPMLSSARRAKLPAPRGTNQVRLHGAHETASTSNGAEVIRSNTKVGRSPSEPLTFHRSEQSFGEVKRSPDQSQKNALASITHPKTWPPFPNTAGNPSALKQESVPGRTDQGRFGREVLSTAPSTLDSAALDSPHSTKSEQDDPWPELPEDRPVSTTNGVEFLRSLERLEALDREQRGGR
jgi:hypothetical protein